MPDDKVRGACPWCLESNFTDTSTRLPGEFRAHSDCAIDYVAALRAAGERNPQLMMGVLRYAEEFKDVDPTWGYQASNTTRTRRALVG